MKVNLIEENGKVHQREISGVPTPRVVLEGSSAKVFVYRDTGAIMNYYEQPYYHLDKANED